MKQILFDVTKPAPAQQELDAMLTCRTKRVALSIKLWCTGWAIVAGVAAYFSLQSAPLISPLAMVVGALGGILVLAGLIILGRTDELSGAQPLALEFCGEMLDLSNASEQSRRYRADVLEQGRQFCHAELALMRKEAKRAEDEAHCKALYEVPT